MTASFNGPDTTASKSVLPINPQLFGDLKMSVFTPKFTTIAACKKETSLIATAASRVATRIQVVAQDLVYHVQQSGDWTVIFPCIDDITSCNGVLKSALREWFEAALHAEINLDDGVLLYLPKASASDIDMDQVLAQAKWFEFKKPSPKAAAKTLSELLAQFETGAKKSIKAGKVSADDAALIVATIEGLISQPSEEAAA
jgi:hypothetical protein